MNAVLPPNPEIRAMCEADLDQVVMIERQIFLFPWTRGNFADSLKVGYLCQVIEEERCILGYSILMIGPDEAHILTLGINPDWQRQGLGEKMLHYLIDLAGEKGAKSVLLDVRESNDGAARLYRQLGFEQIATRKGYYPAMCGREDALVMQLQL